MTGRPADMRAERIAASSVDASLPRPEYPRPDFVRKNGWLCLNGEWQFGFDDGDLGLTAGWSGNAACAKAYPHRIMVPFAYQTPLSGIDDRSIHEIVWYRRAFVVPAEWRTAGRDILLRFEAVDYECAVWINGVEVGRNRGGHVPFAFDVAPYLNTGASENILTVRVADRQNATQPRGKQSVTGLPVAVDYYCTTGIWQPVWLEAAPAMRIDLLNIRPRTDIDGPEGRMADAFDFHVILHAPAQAWTLQIDVIDPVSGAKAAELSHSFYGAGTYFSLVIPNAKRWKPGAPNLYDIHVQLTRGGQVIDEIYTYAGMRIVTLAPDGLHLSGERVYQKLVLDQGYWPDGGMTAPTDDALRADVEWALRFGFNGARKHQKVEAARWLYWCDKLGLMVWGEMANARDWSPDAEDHFVQEWERAVRRDISHPCVVAWVPLNESWSVPGIGQGHPAQYAFVERLALITRRLDLSRPVIDNDGWEHTDISDVLTIHDYTKTGSELRERYTEVLSGGDLPPRTWGDAGVALFSRGSVYHGQPVMLTEIGGLLMIPADTSAARLDNLYNIYGTLRSPEELVERYADILEGVAGLPFVSGFCWTQLTDIEQEKNGLLTYDRTPKTQPERIAAIHARLLPDASA